MARLRQERRAVEPKRLCNFEMVPPGTFNHRLVADTSRLTTDVADAYQIESHAAIISKYLQPSFSRGRLHPLNIAVQDVSGNWFLLCSRADKSLLNCGIPDCHSKQRFVISLPDSLRQCKQQDAANTAHLCCDSAEHGCGENLVQFNAILLPLFLTAATSVR